MHRDGWLIVSDQAGLTLVACPEHRQQFENANPATIPERQRASISVAAWWEPGSAA